MRRFDLPIVALGPVCLALSSTAWTATEHETSAEQAVVVAVVDGEPIYRSEVDRLLGTVSRGQTVNPAVRPVLQAQVLAEIVDRRLVLAYAKRTKSGPTAAAVEAELAELTSKLKRQGSSIERFLKQQSITEADLRRQITWNLAWQKYLARYVTEARLKSYFDSHRREFDGTEIAVSQILLQPKADEGPTATAGLLKKAQAIRREITSGKLSFAAAARKYSAGPSAKDGGRLGPIARHGAMVEAFSRAAFALDVGQVSQPVTTPFGVHLIRCDEIQPGSKRWTEAREPLEKALACELLDRLARFQQRDTPVEFTGKAPYFKPGTRELVLP